MSLKLAARLVPIGPEKIADLQENDTAVHDLDLSSFIPPECMAIAILVERTSGTGYFNVYPRSHATLKWAISSNKVSLVFIEDQVLKWQNTVNNDDWDVYLLGYFVQKRTR